MGVKFKPTIGEALSPWADPVDAMNLLHQFARELSEVAGRVGCTELADYQAVKPLGIAHLYELAQLKDKGLKVTYRDGHYWLDVRDFDTWVSMMSARLRQLPRNAVSKPINSQGELL